MGLLRVCGLPASITVAAETDKKKCRLKQRYYSTKTLFKKFSFLDLAILIESTRNIALRGVAAIPVHLKRSYFSAEMHGAWY